MKKAKNNGGAARKIALFIIISGFLITILATIFANLYANTFFAEKKFEEMARNYYENDFYESAVLENNSASKTETFEKYQNGIRIKLRQVLNWELIEHDADYRAFFITEAFSCDTNESFAKITPRAPFNKNDYDIEINLRCN